MNFDELIDAHTGREENLRRQKENFARSKKHARVRRLAKRELLIKKAARELRKTEVGAGASRGMAGPIILGQGEMLDLARSLVDRAGIRGKTLLVRLNGTHEWNDMDAQRLLYQARYIEIPVYNPGPYGLTAPSAVRAEPYTTTERYEVIDQVYDNGSTAYVLGQVA